MIELNKIHNECCSKTINKFTENFIDLVITSPPYNMNLRVRNNNYCSRQIINEFSTKYNDFKDNFPINDFYKFHKNILKELLKISKLVFYNFQIVTGSKEAFFKIIGDFNKQIKDIIIWDKLNCQPAMCPNVLNRQYEFILILSKKEIGRKFDFCNFERGKINDVWRIPKENKKYKNHSAVFPEKLTDKIIKNFCPKKGIVYDPFCGTGTTFISALKNNVNYIGSEISKEYCEIAEQRIKDYTNQLKLF